MRNHRSGEPDAGKPPVRFGGRGKVKPLRPDPYQKLRAFVRSASVFHRQALFPVQSWNGGNRAAVAKGNDGFVRWIAAQVEIGNVAYFTKLMRKG